MEPDFWKARWAEDRIGWHQADGNVNLREYWRGSCRRVLVPLCGKSPDLLWLADRGHDVVGIEISEIAVAAFFDENALAYTVDDAGLTRVHMSNVHGFARVPMRW